MKRAFLGLVLAAIGTISSAGTAPTKMQSVTITLKDHRFVPDTITVPEGQKIRIDVTNRDATADDFDSDDLHVDRDLKPHEHANFVIEPLRPGRYAFKGELHAATAHGVVIVVPASN